MKLIETKNIWPRKEYLHTFCATAASTWTLEILVAKNKALKTTPTMTPIAKLSVSKTLITVIIITAASVFGAFGTYFREPQSTVPMATMTIIPARIGIGICTTKPPKPMIKKRRNETAIKVDNRLLAPDFTLITDCPIMAQPPMPPKKPVMIFAMPCPRDSLFLLLKESVASSTILAVSKLSTRPTVAMDNE